jgi:hypothetical protein
MAENLMSRVEIHQSLNSAILVCDWHFSNETLLEKKTVIAELGKYHPRDLMSEDPKSRKSRDSKEPKDIPPILPFNMIKPFV